MKLRYLYIVGLTIFFSSIRLASKAQTFGDEGDEWGEVSDPYTSDDNYDSQDYVDYIDPGMGTHYPPNDPNPYEDKVDQVINDDGTTSSWQYVNGAWHESSSAQVPLGSNYIPPTDAPSNGQEVDVQNSDGTVSNWTGYNGVWVMTGIAPATNLGTALTANGDGSYTLTFSDGSSITTNTNGTWTVVSDEGDCLDCTAGQASVYIPPASEPPTQVLPPNPTQGEIAAYENIIQYWDSSAHSSNNSAVVGIVDAEPTPGLSNNDTNLVYFNPSYNPYNYPTQTEPSYNAMYNAWPKSSRDTTLPDGHTVPYDLPSSQVYSLAGGTLVTFYNNYFSTHHVPPNACALRMSIALVTCGINIPNIPGITYAGSNGKYYFISSPEMYNFLIHTFPPSENSVIQLTEADGGSNGDQFQAHLLTHQGIYVMQSANEAEFGAYGHCSLYDGETAFGTHTYVNAEGGVAKIALWILK